MSCTNPEVPDHCVQSVCPAGGEFDFRKNSAGTAGPRCEVNSVCICVCVCECLHVYFVFICVCILYVSIIYVY